MSPTTGSPLAQLESTLEEYFDQKAPYQLPQNVRETIVKFAPWIIIILMVMSLPVIFGALALTALFSPVSMAVGSMSMYWVIPALVLVASLIFDLMAVPGLFNRTMQGWRYAYYAQLLSIVSSLLYGNIISALFGAVIGFFILFQVKRLYK